MLAQGDLLTASIGGGNPYNRGGEQPRPTDVLYGQDICESCGAAVYSDELILTDHGLNICPKCYMSQMSIGLSRSRLLLQTRVPLIGVSMIEFLLAALILGVLAAVTVPPMLGLKQRADQYLLSLLLFQNENADITDVATGIARGKGDLTALIQQAAELAGVPPEEMEEFEEDIQNRDNSALPSVQAGSIIKTIERWKAKLKTDQTDDLNDLEAIGELAATPEKP